MPGQKPLPFPVGAPLAPLVEAFLVDAKTEGTLSDKSLPDYRSNLRRLVEFYPDLPVEAFDGPHGTRLLLDFLATLPEDSRRKARSQLRAFWAYLIYFQKVVFDPTTRIKAPKPKRQPRKPQSVQTIQRVIDAQPFLDWRLAIRLGGQLGLRRGSVRGIRYRDFDLGARTVTVTLKGGRRERNPLIYDDIVLAVEQLRQDGHKDDHFLLYPRRRNNLPSRHDGQDWILDPAKQLSDTAFTNWWRDCLVRADVPHFDFHTLRTSAASELYLGSRDVYAVSKALNHVKVETTVQHYINVGDIPVIEAHSKTGWRDARS